MRSMTSALGVKKIIILLSIILVSFFSANNTFAVEKIKVSVPIDFSSVFSWEVTCSQEWEKPNIKYYCMVPKWTSWFQVVMAWIIKYTLFISSLAWVLFIVINWILYSMAWMNDSLKTESKDRITKTLIWIVLLLMSWTILHILAPWVYK